MGCFSFICKESGLPVASSSFDGDACRLYLLKNDKFYDIEIDSLDCLLIVIYMCELFNVPEEIGKEFNPVNIRELYDSIMEHKTQVPESIEAAIKEIE